MSLFKRLLKAGNRPSKKEQDTKDPESSNYYPEKKLPIDEKFTYHFKNNGGKFIYCENWDEIHEAFDNIMAENDWYEQQAFCLDDQLCKKFDGYNLDYVKRPNATFFLTQCESLVSNTGAILLSSNQVKELKLHDLPPNMIVLATTSQIVENPSEGLAMIKNRNQNLPSNITSIQNFETEKEKNFMHYGSSTKNLYLLLLEDL